MALHPDRDQGLVMCVLAVCLLCVGCGVSKSTLKAVEEGDAAAVQAALDGGLDPNVRVGGEYPLLAYAGNATVADVLISAGARVNVTESHGNTPLHFASHLGRYSTAEALIKAGATVDSVNWDRQTPLHWATTLSEVFRHDRKNPVGGHTLDVADKRRCVELLLASGADVNAMSTFGTPLHGARSDQNRELVDLLLEHGADATIPRPY